MNTGKEGMEKRSDAVTLGRLEFREEAGGLEVHGPGFIAQLAHEHGIRLLLWLASWYPKALAPACFRVSIGDQHAEIQVSQHAPPEYHQGMVETVLAEILRRAAPGEAPERPAGPAILAGLRVYGFDLDPEKAWDGRIIPPHWLVMLPITARDRTPRLDIASKQKQIDAILAPHQGEQGGAKE
jgi:hypothetical protein